MGKERDLATADYRDLLLYAPVHGATNAIASHYPGAFESKGIRPRDPARNVLLGITVTRPDPGLVVFGVAYVDLKDRGTHDEDIYTVDLGRQTVKKFEPREWQTLHPEYGDYHHSPKLHFSKTL